MRANMSAYLFDFIIGRLTHTKHCVLCWRIFPPVFKILHINIDQEKKDREERNKRMELDVLSTTSQRKSPLTFDLFSYSYFGKEKLEESKKLKMK